MKIYNNVDQYYRNNMFIKIRDAQGKDPKKTKYNVPLFKQIAEELEGKKESVSPNQVSVDYKGTNYAVDMEAGTITNTKTNKVKKTNRRKNEKEALNVLNDYVTYVSNLFNDGKSPVIILCNILFSTGVNPLAIGISNP